MAKHLNRFNLPVRANEPASAQEGELWYASNSDQLKWKSWGNYSTSVSEGHMFNDFAVNRWYQTQPGVATTATMTVSRAYAVAFSMPRYARVSGIALEIISAFATTAGTLRIGVYDDAGGRMPNNKVLEPSTVPATAGIKTFTTTLDLPAGTYWLVAAVQGASGTAGSWRSVAGVQQYISDPSATPTATFMSGTANCYYSDTGFTSTFPTTFGAVAGITSGPRFAIKFAF